jgi:hypothetical protein
MISVGIKNALGVDVKTLYEQGKKARYNTGLAERVTRQQNRGEN